MLGLTGLHSMAAARGDGLRPELLDLFRQRDRLDAGNVRTLRASNGDCQSGPNPTGRADAASATNVLLFPAVRK